jgi:A/G-specific adenine glycosylase
MRTDTSREISAKLLNWWKQYGRKYSWRLTEDPYKIMIAELMLHRTKASQVDNIFSNFVEKYPKFENLTTADPSEIVNILRPLGLNWRNEYFVDLIKEIKLVYGGQMPIKKKELMSLPGVGDYVASAVRCFAYGYAEVVLDINTSRIISRLNGFRQTGEMRRKKRVRNAYLKILDRKNPREFNYALLDLGAIICTSHDKKCYICPLSEWCVTAKNEVIK